MPLQGLKGIAAAAVALGFLITPSEVTGQRIAWPSHDGTPIDTRISLLSGPRFEVGTAGGAEESTLSIVTGAVRLHDGRIVIADAGNSRLVIYDAGRDRIRTVGREGAGPGEFRLPMWIGRCGRSRVAVFDPMNTALLLFDGDLRYRQNRRTPAELGFNSPVWCGQGERLLAVLRRPAHVQIRGRVFQVPSFLARVTGARLDTLARLGAQEFYVSRRVPAYSEVPLGRATLVAAGKEYVFSGDNHEGSITVHDTAGRKVREFRIPIRRRPITRAHWEDAVERQIERTPMKRSRELQRLVLAELEPPEQLPLLADLFADSTDRLWIRTFDNHGSHIATWIVLTPDGQPIAAVAVPAEFSPLDAGSGYLVGLHRDASGVERVQGFELRGGALE